MARFVGEPLPDCVVLRPSWVRQVLLSMVALGAAALTNAQIPEGMTIPLDGERLRWVALSIWGGLFFVFLLQILPQVSSIRVCREGLQVRAFVQAETIRWSECSEFKEPDPEDAHFLLPHVEFVWGDLTKTVPAFGMSPKELAEVLNRFRARALAEAAH